MGYLGGLIWIFALLQLAVAFANLIFRQKFPKTGNGEKPLVSVLIPARNEEANIGNLLQDLITQEYKNIEILVFNDQSDDSTEEIIKGFERNDSRVRLIQSPGLPNGWLGKNHACFQLASQAKGRYFLFLDADVRIGDSIIQNTLNFSEKYNTALVSIFPEQIMKTWGERLTVPNMNYILLTLLPLILVRKTKFPSLAAANGQFMFFLAESYRRFQPHEKVKNSKVEDIKIARFLKMEKQKIACLTGDSSISCRMYNGFSEAVHGFSKNVIQFFGGSFLTAILFWLLTTFGFLIVLFNSGLLYMTIYLFIAVFTRIFISVVSKQNGFINVFFMAAHQFSLGLFILNAAKISLKKQYLWKGRTITH